MKLTKTILCLLLTTVIIVMGSATFIEQAHDAAFAQEHVYHTWWFFALWLSIAMLSAFYLWQQRLWKRTAVFALHLSLLLILLGAGITFTTSKEGRLHLRSQGSTNIFYTKEGMKDQLPFTLSLDSFSIAYYPGTQAPQDFVSYVSIDKNQHTQISMNHVLEAEGYRLYQSSFDPDLHGTVLGVSYDPYGMLVTYLGYALLGLSMVAVLLSRREEFRQLLRSPLLKKGFLMLVLSTMAITTVSARSIPTINADEAQKAARMQIVYNNRVAPFSTLAHDFLSKIYGKSSYCGLSAEQVVYGWLARPDAWKNEPMIYIKSGQLRRQLNITDKYVSMAQLFDGDEYILNRLMTDGEPQIDKAVQELDEKVGLILMLTNGQLIRPVPQGVPQLSTTRIEAEILYNTIPFCKFLFMFCLTMGLITFVVMVYRAKHPSVGLNRAWTFFRICLYATCIVHASAYALHWYIAGRIPLGNGYETMLFLALVLLVLSILLHRRLSFILPFGFLLTGFALLVAWLGQRNPQITPLMPVLQSPILASHVSIIMMAYALMAFMMLNGIFALFTDQMHRQQLTVLSRLMLYPAVFMLSAGIFLGAIWANVSWGKYWSWDPKEVWALITLLIYAVPLHTNSIPVFRRPKVLHAYLIAAFLTVLMTYFGVNYLLGGMHSYA